MKYTHMLYGGISDYLIFADLSGNLKKDDIIDLRAVVEGKSMSFKFILHEDFSSPEEMAKFYCYKCISCEVIKNALYTE
jgi:hypothetical protein